MLLTTDLDAAYWLLTRWHGRDVRVTEFDSLGTDRIAFRGIFDPRLYEIEDGEDEVLWLRVYEDPLDEGADFKINRSCFTGLMGGGNEVTLSGEYGSYRVERVPDAQLALWRGFVLALETAPEDTTVKSVGSEEESSGPVSVEEARAEVERRAGGMMVTVSFEEVLAVLLGWVGRRLSVGIATAGDAPIMIGNMAGTLRAGSELEAHGEEAVYFHFKDAGTGFILARQHFAGGGWHEKDRSTLVVRLGAVSLWIEQEEHA